MTQDRYQSQRRCLGATLCTGAKTQRKAFPVSFRPARFNFLSQSNSLEHVTEDLALTHEVHTQSAFCFPLQVTSSLQSTGHFCLIASLNGSLVPFPAFWSHRFYIILRSCILESENSSHKVGVSVARILLVRIKMTARVRFFRHRVNFSSPECPIY